MKRSHEASDGDVASPQQRIQASEGGAAGAAASEVVDLTGEEDCEGAFAGDELARELTQALASHVVDLTAEDEDEDAEGRGRDEDEVQFVSESRPPSAKERQRQPAAPLGRRAEVGKDDGAGIDVLKEHRFFIHNFLKKKAAVLAIKSVEENPHSKPGTPLFNRFIQAWANVRDSTVELVFHGAAEANVPSILRDGLDPQRRAGQALGRGEYFAEARLALTVFCAPLREDAMVSVAYCKGGRKMLVFAVLVDKSGITCRQGGVVVIHKPEHQLPLFVVSFDEAETGKQQLQNFSAMTMPSRAFLRSRITGGGGGGGFPFGFGGGPPAQLMSPPPSRKKGRLR